jgi:hypothetical protein
VLQEIFNASAKKNQLPNWEISGRVVGRSKFLSRQAGRSRALDRWAGEGPTTATPRLLDTLGRAVRGPPWLSLGEGEYEGKGGGGLGQRGIVCSTHNEMSV